MPLVHKDSIALKITKATQTSSLNSEWADSQDESRNQLSAGLADKRENLTARHYQWPTS